MPITGDDLRSLSAEPEALPPTAGGSSTPHTAVPAGPSAGTAGASSVAKQLIQRQKARKDLIEFACFVDEAYEPFPVHKLIARKLEDVEAGRTRRLAIFLPPAIGKSRLASEIFVAWLFGRNPGCEVIEGSYNKDKAAEFGSIARDTIRESRFGLVFPGVEISASAAAADSWRTTAGGSYKASGVAGGIIGFHAHYAILDDPFKNYQEASSLQYREEVWNWYSAVLLNRLRSYKDGPGAVVLIMQRWHDDDLGGRIQKLSESGEEKWDILSISSFAEAGDPLGREPGAVLLPEGPNRRPEEELIAIRARNPNLFMALHQQKPVSDEGDLFHPGWLVEYQPSELPRNLVYYGSSDWALSKGSGNYTVHMVFGLDTAGHLWLVDLFRGQVDPPAGVERCIEMMLERKPLKWFNERVMLTKAIGPLLRKRKTELQAWTVLEEVSITGLGSKGSPDRAGSIAGAMQMGYVHVPANAPWLGELKYELSRFPNGRDDDQVDALSLIGIKLNTLRGGAAAPVQPKGVPLIRPVLYTFDQVMGHAKQQRQGVRLRKESMVLPAEPTVEWPETCVN